MKPIHKKLKESMQAELDWENLLSKLPTKARHMLTPPKPIHLADYWTRMADRDDYDQIKTRMAIKRNQHAGKVYIYDWGMDCDHCASDRVNQLDADFETVRDYIAGIYASAEGQTVVRFVTKKEADEFISTFRDYGMEAYENGHPHYITFDGE